MRVVIAQPWPECMQTMPAAGSTSAKFASSRMMFADLPPSSRNTRFSVSAPRAAMCLPTAVEPVNEIMSTSGRAGQHVADRGGVGRGHDVEHAGGDVGLLGDDLADPRGRVRRVGRGLQDHRATGREGGRDLRQVEHEREVPRRDRADDADGLADDEPVRVDAEELVVAELVLPLVAVDHGRCPTACPRCRCPAGSRT